MKRTGPTTVSWSGGGAVPKAPPLYRYMSARYADELVLHGKIKIGTAVSFGALETPQSDDLDSGVKYVLPYASDRSPGAIENMRKLGMMFKDCSNWTAVDTVRTDLLNAHVLCFCLNSDSEHFLSQSQDVAVLEFFDLDGFITVLMDHERRLGEDAHADKVSYEPREFDVRDEKKGSVDPFIKRPIFSVEEEYRVVWPNTERIEPIIASVPALRDFVRRVR